MKAAALVWAERVATGIAALVLAALLKHHYSQASAEELRWMLAPTAGLTSLVLHRDFVFRAGEGYLSRELSILISPACAGVNFLIVAFLSLALGFDRRFAELRKRAAWLVASLCIAYAAALVANTLRISVSVWVAHAAARWADVTFQAVHRLIGVAVYLSSLGLLCAGAQFWLPSRRRQPQRVSALAVALVCYLGVTLGLPLLRGGWREPAYWSHALPVLSLALAASGVVLTLLFAGRGRNWDDGRYAVRSPERPQ